MPKKRKPGRPALPAAQRKTANLTFRVRGDLRERLQKAAAGSGRSISEEVEQRLEDSFRRESADKVLEEAQRLLEEARRMNEDAVSAIDEIEKDLRAGLTVDDIFPPNALLRKHALRGRKPK